MRSKEANQRISSQASPSEVPSSEHCILAGVSKGPNLEEDGDVLDLLLAVGQDRGGAGLVDEDSVADEQRNFFSARVL